MHHATILVHSPSLPDSVAADSVAAGAVAADSVVVVAVAVAVAADSVAGSALFWMAEQAELPLRTFVPSMLVSCQINSFNQSFWK